MIIRAPFSFRLTPEEQELKYKLKAKMMRKLDEQNNNLKQELMAHQKLTQLKRQQVRATSARLGRDDKLSRINAVQLMRMYEKKANQGGCHNPANMRRWPNVGLLLGQRRRRSTNNNSTLGQRIMFAGKWENRYICPM